MLVPSIVPAVQETAADALVGRALGDFVVRERLASGGHATVYRAQQTGLSREVVVKVLHERHRTSAALVGRFLREAQLASRIDHPFAAHVYAFGAEPDGVMWIAMEQVRGTPLDELVAAQGPLGLARFGPLFDRICEVVQAVHELGIIHRDLKPSNVMVLARAGRLVPKLLDLGIARALDDAEPPVAAAPGAAIEQPARLTQRGRLVGSPPYMAPEQWLNPAAVDARADVYALGVLAFECLTGRLPFAGATTAAIAAAHASQPVPRLGPELPPALDDVLGRALAKAAADRYPSVAELAAAMAAAGAVVAGPPRPRLDDDLGRAVLTDFPQPLAEAVAAAESARTAVAAQAAWAQVVHVAIRLIGLIALACRARLGGERAAESAEVTLRVRELARGQLDDAGWLAVADAVGRGFLGRRDAFPVPELIDLLDDRHAELAALVVRRYEPAAAEVGLGELVAAVGRLLGGLRFLADYPLVVARDGRAERWTGTRRTHRATLAAAVGADGQPALVGRDGAMVVSLWPLVQAVAPTVGAAAELFLLDGRGRTGARLIAFPSGFEHHDPTLWDAFARDRFGLGGGDDDDNGVDAGYRGLTAYTSADRASFLGRELEVEHVLNRLRIQPLIAVVGPSGVGKSSFVQAGVLAGLPPGWRAVVLRPGASPLASLAAALTAAGVDGVDRDLLARDPGALGAGLRRAGPAGFALVVDQLEELFTLGAAAADRDGFVAAVAAAARTADEPVRVIVTLRDDFLVRAQQLAPLRDALAAGLQLLTTPAPAALRRILIEPARRRGYTFDDPELPTRMVDAVGGEPGALALLSFAAARLWERRDRGQRTLPAQAYAAMGGVGGALGQHAEETLAAMAPGAQLVVRAVFRRLLNAEGARLVHDRRELRDAVGPSGEAVVEQLIAARLVVASEGPAGEELVEVVHEALLPAWPRLLAWRREDADGLRMRDQLQAAAQGWDRRGRPRGLLWRALALTELELWRARWSDALTPVGAAFAAASRAEANRGRRRRRLLVAGGFAALAVMLVVVLALNRRATRDRAAADQARAAAEASDRTSRHHLLDLFAEHGRLALVAGDPMRGLVYLSAAYSRSADDAAVRYLLARALAAAERELATMPAISGRLFHATFSPDGGTIATAGDAPSVQLWDGTTGAARAVLAAGTANLTDVGFAPDGATVVAASKDGRAYLWDVATGARRAVLRDAGWLRLAHYSPDGATIVTAGRAGHARLWDAATGQLRFTLPHAAPVSVAVFSPDGRWLVTGSDDGVARLWSTATGAPVAVLSGHGPGIMYAAFTPDGTRVVTCGAELTIGVWSVPAGRRVGGFSIDRHPQGVLAIAVSPDGALVATGGEDGTAVVWDLATGRPRTTLAGHRSTVRLLQFGPEPGELVTASEDGTAKIWDVDHGELLTTLSGHTGTVWTVDVDARRARLVTASIDGTARLWDAQRRDHRLTLEQREAHGLRAVRVSADGATVAAVDVAGGIAAWDLATGRRLATNPGAGRPTAVAVDAAAARVFAVDADGGAHIRDARTGVVLVTLTGHKTPMLAAAFSPTGDRLATSGVYGWVQLWDATTGAALAPWPTARFAATNDLAFDPTGAYLAVARDDGTVVIADAATGAARVTLRGGHGLGVASVRFSADGRRVVTGGRDKVACVWDAATGALLASLTGHASELTAAEFSPDGALVATASYDATARMWDARDGRLLGVVAHHPLPVTSIGFTPDGRTLVSVAHDGLARLWDVDRDIPAPAEVARRVRCWAPYRLDGTRLLPTPRACAP